MVHALRHERDDPRVAGEPPQQRLRGPGCDTEAKRWSAVTRQNLNSACCGACSAAVPRTSEIAARVLATRSSLAVREHGAGREARATPEQLGEHAVEAVDARRERVQHVGSAAPTMTRRSDRGG
jgi:hypothetical protein